MHYVRLLLIIFFQGFAIFNVHAQCNRNYNWTSWQNFTGSSATGVIKNNGKTVHVTMSTNYRFQKSDNIYAYYAFDGFNSHIPDSTLPQTSWPDARNGITKMCFDTTVTNPALLVASLGDDFTPVKLSFSRPFQLVYKDSNVVKYTDTTLTGAEGYAILVFPGNVDCITIYADTTEHWTNLTWGLNDFLPQINFLNVTTACDSVVITATGGDKYEWSGGVHRTSATNTFYENGIYSVTVANNVNASLLHKQM